MIALGSLRQDLLEAARSAVAEDLLPGALHGRERQVGVVLGGSAVTEDADEYSGCDLVVLAQGCADGPARLAWDWTEVRRSPSFYRYAELPLTALRQGLKEGDDGALSLAFHGLILHDPDGRLARLWAEVRQPDPALWRRKLALGYRAFRERRASLAWALRRGQPILVLDNLRLLLEHALNCCYYLAGQPAPPAKWAFRGGLRTPAGRRLRAPVLDLLSSLGDLAMLGGSLNLRQNRIYRQVERIQIVLEEVLVDGGLPVPSLASEAGGARRPRTPRTRSLRNAEFRQEGSAGAV